MIGLLAAGIMSTQSQSESRRWRDTCDGTNMVQGMSQGGTQRIARLLLSKGKRQSRYGVSFLEL
jgi:hypothetical protein